MNLRGVVDRDRDIAVAERHTQLRAAQDDAVRAGIYEAFDDRRQSRLAGLGGPALHQLRVDQLVDEFLFSWIRQAGLDAMLGQALPIERLAHGVPSPEKGWPAVAAG